MGRITSTVACLKMRVNKGLWKYGTKGHQSNSTLGFTQGKTARDSRVRTECVFQDDIAPESNGVKRL